MHSKGIIHKDLKLSNILLSSKENGEYDIRIIDFGFSHFINSKEDKKVLAGTPGFTAPEMLNTGIYDCKADIFSVGAIAYRLLTGQFLFTGKTASEQMAKNKSCDEVLYQINQQD